MPVLWKILITLGLLALVAAGTWWLTGIDKTHGGESKRSHHLTRALRCVAVVFLSAIFFGLIGSSGLSYGDMPILIIVPVGVALILRSSLSELFTGGFLRLLDPALHDDRPLDLKQAQRYQDALARMIHNGQREEAIKLCEELKQSGELDIVTLENILEFLGVKRAAAPAKPLVVAGRLRVEGKFAEAEQLLNSLLAKNPADDAAAMMLMRLYAQNLRQPERAQQVLLALEKQPHVRGDHLEFARRSINEWSQEPPPLPASAPSPRAESVDDLLAQGSFGMAVEMLEAQIKSQPGDFELQLKLAEVYAVHCKDSSRAEKIVHQMEQASNVSPQQLALARAKLAEWHK